MSTTLEKPPHKPAGTLPTVSGRLAALRSRIVMWFVVEGLAYLLWAALALAVGSFLLDFFFRLDPAQRTFLLVAIGVTLLLFAQRVVRPLTTPLTDDGLILEVERRHPELAESLISAVQFKRLEDRHNPNTSLAMVEATILRGNEAAQQIRFNDVINSSGLIRNMLLLVASLAVVAGLVFGSTQIPHIRIWFQRNILLQSVPWPQNTYLQVVRGENGVIRIPRGDDYLLEVICTEASTQAPERVFVDFRDGRAALAMKRREENLLPDSIATYEAVIANVIQPFQFRVRGGDERTDYLTVELVEPPAVDELQLAVTFPAYAGGKTEPLPSGKGPYFILPGSSLQLTGVGNKPLAKAALAREGERFDLQIKDGKLVSGQLSPEQLQTGQYAIELTDTEGLTARKPITFGLRLRPDREPKVRARLVGIGGMVTARARIPLSIRVTDDYGLTKLGVPYVWRGDNEERKEGTGELPLPAALYTLVGAHVELVEPESSAGDEALPARLVLVDILRDSAAEKAGLKVGDEVLKVDNQSVADYDEFAAQLGTHAFGELLTLEVRRDKKPRTFEIKLTALDLTFEDVLNLEPLQIPTGTGLSFYVSAADNDDYPDDPKATAGPNLGKSPDFSIRVVTDEELRADLLRREKEQRQEFERLTKHQEELLTFSRELRAQLDETEDFVADQKQKLAQSPKTQKLIGTNSGSVTQRLTSIVIEIVNNRLDEGAVPGDSPGEESTRKVSLEKRLREKIVAPLVRLQAEDFPEAVRLVENARRATGEKEVRIAAMQSAVDHQAALVEEMKQILEEMAQAEGFQEAVNLLYEVDKAQRELLERTRKAKEEKEKGIIQGSDSSKPKETPSDTEPKPAADKPAEDKPAADKPADENVPVPESKPDTAPQ